MATYFGNASDHIDNKTFDCSEAGDMLSTSLPYCKRDLIALALDQPDIHVDVTDILRQCSAGTSDSDEAGLDVDGDSLRNVELFGLEDVPHLRQMAKSLASVEPHPYSTKAIHRNSPKF